MKTKLQSQVALDNARQDLGVALKRVKELRETIDGLRLTVRLEREMLKQTRKIEREQKRAAKITAMEQRLADLRLKASAPKTIRKNYRKASKGVVYTPEQIAELNKTLGLVEV